MCSSNIHLAVSIAVSSAGKVSEEPALLNKISNLPLVIAATSVTASSIDGCNVTSRGTTQTSSKALSAGEIFDVFRLVAMTL